LITCVKNTLLDLSKHIKGEKQKADEQVMFVPIFWIYTNFDHSKPIGKNINIIHDPSE